MRQGLVVWVAAMAVAGAAATAGELEAGFRSPPADCRPTLGWFHSHAFAEALGAVPAEVRPAFARALADGGLSTTPEEIKRISAWQALVDARVITQPGLPARPPRQPYDGVAERLDAFVARLVYLCRKSQAVGGVFTQAKAAHGLTLYPPAPGLYLARRKLGDADLYLAVSQRRLDTTVTITFPTCAGLELWDPEDGSIRDAPTYHTDAAHKHTMLNLRLGPYQALAIVLRKPPSQRHVTFASSALDIAEVAADGASVKGLARVNGRASVMFANGTMGMATVEGLPEPLVLESGWTMRTASPAKRGSVGVVAVRIKRANADQENAAAWAAPDFDDSAWTSAEIGRPEAAAAVSRSPWTASWLVFEGNNQQRLFRKTFVLDEPAELATVTLSADNGYVLFVNGQRIGTDGNWSQAETYDVAKALRKGTNAFAVLNTNQGGVGGLLLEARVRLASGKLHSIVTDATWKVARQAPDGWQKADFDDAAWGRPTVKGKPPVEPWGDVPGLPAAPAGGQVVWYRFRLPAGARSVRVPGEAREPRLFVGGKPVVVKAGAADLSGRVPNGPVVAALRLAGMAALESPILVECGERAVGVGNWLLIGYATYSGAATYSIDVVLPEAFRKERLVLDLGEVGCTARVSVNGRDLATRLWRPYVSDITDAVRPGRNRIVVSVANTAANASGEALPAERLAGGLIGPVRIRCLRAVTLRAK